MQYFTTKTREDGSTYSALVEDHPQWLLDAVRKAHNDELPNDWRWNTCAAIWDAIVETGAPDDDEDNYDYDDFEERIAYNLVSPYTTDILRWFLDYPTRTSYIDEVLEEDLRHIGADELMHTAQLFAIQRMVAVLAAAYRNNT